MFELQARLVGDWAERSGRGPIRAPRAGHPSGKCATPRPAPAPVSAMADPDQPRHGSSP